jgi:phosphoribosylanthranilate isomerase
MFVKVCGVVSVADALMAVDAGADALGVNLVPSSKRRVDLATARAVRDGVGERAEVIAVVADLPGEELGRIRAETGIEWLQLHGAEPPSALTPLLPRAYKAVGIATAADVELAASYGGERLLVDARVPGELGGTGHTFDWSLVARLAKGRRLILAGGLTPDNVGLAVAQLSPWGVDVASGVERSPREKDPERVRAFVRAARAAAAR